MNNQNDLNKIIEILKIGAVEFRNSFDKDLKTKFSNEVKEDEILGKVVKPKLIPKMDFANGIDKENATFVVIPTIIKTREKVQELFKYLEVFYLANKSENLYFSVLGDCSESNTQEEKFDQQVIDEGLKQVQKLNEKYPNQEFPIFHFIYRERK